MSAPTPQADIDAGLLGSPLVAEIGRKQPDAAVSDDLAGLWRCAGEGAELEVAVRGGKAEATLGTGPLRAAVPLRPLGGNRALLERAHGPWRQRACLWLRGPGALRLVTQRSRVLDFRRA